MIFSDAHLHLTSCGNGYPEMGTSELILSCTAEYSEWAGQASLKRPDSVIFYGIHPWYAGQLNGAAIGELVEILAGDPDAHVGEIGLDSKYPDMESQESAFAAQLSIASDLERCINVHNIGCDGRIVAMIKEYGPRCRSVILHSFKSPDTRPFSGLNCYYSLNPRILSKSKESIAGIVSNIPKDRLLVETDFPNVPEGFSTMKEFIVRLAEAADMDPEELSAAAADNLRRALQ